MSNNAPFHLLVSYAYLRKSSWIDIDQFSEACWFMLDSGAFTNHANDLKLAKRGHDNPASITLDEYCDFLKERGDVLYGAVMLDRIGDEETSMRNLHIMVDRGLKPIPVVTVDQEPERVNEYAAINPIICAPSGFGRAYTEQFRKQRFSALYAAAESPVYLHGLGYTRYPGLLQTPLHSADSSSFTSGLRFGNVIQFGVKGLTSVHRTSITNEQAMMSLPLKLDIAAIRRGDPYHCNGRNSAVASTGAIAYSKFQRLSWLREKRLFLAASNLQDTILALAAWWCVNVDSQPRTLKEFIDLRDDLVRNGRIRDSYFKVMKQIKDTNRIAPYGKVSK